MPKNTKSAHLMTSDGRKIALNRKVESGLLAILEIEAAKPLIRLAIVTRKIVERTTAKAGA